MKPSKDNKPAYSRKTKAQLIEELEQVSNLLSEKEEMLEEAQELLSTVGPTSDESGKLKEELEETKAKLEEADAFAEDMTSRAEQLEKEVESLHAQIGDLKKQAIDEDEINALNKEFEKSEKLRKALKEEKENLEDKLNDLLKKQPAQEANSEIEVQPIESSKSTFLIEIYPRNGGYSGRIQHALTKNQKTFKGLDKEAIYQFIHAHRPQDDDALPERMQATSASGKPLASIVKGSAHIHSFALKTRGNAPGKQMPASTPFRAEMTLDLHELASNFSGKSLDYDIQIYARQLGKRRKDLVAETKTTAPWAESLAGKVDQISLPAGNYQLITIATFQTTEGSTVPCDSLL